MPRNRSTRSHGRTDQMGTPTRPLPALEITVGRLATALAGFKPVIVHGQAHGAPGLAPFKARSLKNLVEALLLGLCFHQAGTWYHQREAHVRSHTPAAYDMRSGPQIFDA